MRPKWMIPIVSLLLCVAIVAAQNVECTEVIQTAIANAEEECSSITRNQACFGHVALDATGQPDAANFQFASIGDIVEVASIQSLELAGFNSETGAWGVVLMRVQANLPNTLPGQNVTVILFGDTTLRNAASSVSEQIPPEQQRSISANTGVDVHALPSLSSTILSRLNSGAQITVTGRTADSLWIRIVDADQIGWITSASVASGSNLEELSVINPDIAQYGPMQAFYLSTGIGRPACNAVPDDGMMIQTPRGGGTINLAVNGLSVQMGSTVYFNLNDNQSLSVMPVEGAARVSSGGVTRTAIAGTRIQIQLADDYTVEGEPSIPESYLGDEDVEDLPYAALEREIDWDAGLDEDEYAHFIEYGAVFEGLDLEDLDDVFGYIEDHQDDSDFDLLGYLIYDLGYDDFDDDLQAYFEDEGYDFDDYDSYSDDDIYDDAEDDSFDDSYDDEYDDAEDDESFDDSYDDDSYDDASDE